MRTRLYINDTPAQDSPRPPPPPPPCRARTRSRARASVPPGGHAGKRQRLELPLQRARARRRARRRPASRRGRCGVAPTSKDLRAETCPISTEGWTRRVQLVREGGGLGALAGRGGASIEHAHPRAR